MTWQSSRNSLNSTRAGRFRGISPFNTRGVGNPVPFSWNPFRFRYVIAMFYAEFPHVDCKISAKIGWSNWSCRVFKPPLMVTPYFLIKSLNPMSVHVGGETAPRKVVKSQLLMVENPPFFSWNPLVFRLWNPPYLVSSPYQNRSLIKYSSPSPKVTDTKGGSGGEATRRVGCPGVWGELRQFNQVVYRWPI